MKQIFRKGCMMLLSVLLLVCCCVDVQAAADYFTYPEIYMFGDINACQMPKQMADAYADALEIIAAQERGEFAYAVFADVGGDGYPVMVTAVTDDDTIQSGGHAGVHAVTLWVYEDGKAVAYDFSKDMDGVQLADDLSIAMYGDRFLLCVDMNIGVEDAARCGVLYEVKNANIQPVYRYTKSGKEYFLDGVSCGSFAGLQDALDHKDNDANTNITMNDTMGGNTKMWCLYTNAADIAAQLRNCTLEGVVPSETSAPATEETQATEQQVTEDVIVQETESMVEETDAVPQEEQPIAETEPAKKSSAVPVILVLVLGAGAALGIVMYKRKAK